MIIVKLKENVTVQHNGLWGVVQTNKVSMQYSSSNKAFKYCGISN